MSDYLFIKNDLKVYLDSFLQGCDCNIIDTKNNAELHKMTNTCPLILYIIATAFI